MDQTRTRLKVCCISSVAEAQLAIKHGANALGLVSNMPSGPGVVPEETIAQIASSVPPGLSTFLLTSLVKVDQIIEQQKRCGVNTIQICDRIEEGTHRDLREALPGISLVQVVHVTGDESVEEAIEVSSKVDAILLDSGNQSLATKELGGTGKTHDWSLSRKIRDSIEVPLFLAGGLKESNIKEAIDRVQPYGVDLCSGLRTDDQLDEQKLAGFTKALWN